MYLVYCLRCCDNTIYCGTTNNLTKRLHAHNNLKTGAKYTKTRRPVFVLKYFICDTKSDALKLEYKIKQLTKKQKELLCNNETKTKK